MTLRVFMQPSYDTPDRAEGGIRRVVTAMHQYLPAHGIEFVRDIERADLAVGHGQMHRRLPGQPFVAAVHGLHWADYSWQSWAHEVNAEVIEGMVQAQAITAPSQWVARALTRGIARRPVVIYHGVDAEEWTPSRQHGGYVLWNKARADPVSNPHDMQKLAAQMNDVSFVTTVGEHRENVRVIGVLPQPDLKAAIQNAGVYLATARETFGIGTLEALASGVPVAGWDYGGQSEIIVPGETGYLAPFGDYDALAEAVRRCLSERERLAANAIGDIRLRWQWPDKIRQYADLFCRVVDGAIEQRPRVSVVVPAYNLAQFLPETLESVKAQSEPNFECVIVDDCSTDDTAEVAKRYLSDARFRYHRTPKNSGLSAVRNLGASVTRGKNLVFLDADDKLTPDALSMLAGALDADPTLHISYGSLALMRQDGRPLETNNWPWGFEWRQQIAHINQIHTAAMMRREVWEELGGYRERCWRAEDADFWVRATSFGFRARKVTEAISLIYRMRHESKGQTEYRTLPDKDGDWMRPFPWRIAGTAQEGDRKLSEGPNVPNAHLVPFSAQGKPTINRGFAWNAYHHESPAVSVVIPVGPGHTRHVLDALDGLIAQDIHSWEAVVVNDTGETWDEVPGAPWARVVQGQRKGPGAARNTGAKAARAPVLLFQDADDWLLPGALRAMLADYARGDTAYIYGDYRELIADFRTERPKQLADYNQHQWLGQHAITVLMAKEHFLASGGFDEQLAGWEDWEFFCNLAVRGMCGRRVPVETFLYRMHSGFHRDKSLALGETLLPVLKARYGEYYDGGKEMGSCCPGGGEAIMAAKEALAWPTGEAVVTPSARPEQRNGLRPPVMRMEFTGDRVGAVTYHGQNGRTYSGGNNALERFADVNSDDVDMLKGTGVWKVIDLPAPVSEPEHIAPMEQFPSADRSALDPPLIESLTDPFALGEPKNGNGHHAEDVPLVETQIPGWDTDPGKLKLTEIKEWLPKLPYNTQINWLRLEHQRSRPRKRVIELIEDSLQTEADRRERQKAAPVE